jgi:CO/xanthine dehydrogenase Mo-binding subunit
MLDARERVTGRVPYTINLRAPLQAALLRSTLPHARIRSIDASAARRVPGVAAVLTGADLAGRSDVSACFGPVFRDQPMLAIGKVRHVGEPVAAVAAVDLDAALDALERIEVEYEELPAVFDVGAALAEGAVLVHDDDRRAGETFADIITRPVAGTNICNHFRLRKGDVEAGFAEADHVFEDRFSSPPVQHVPLETHACIAEWIGGRLTVTATSQSPHALRAQLAEVFRLPATRVRVVVPTLGGGYGGKAYPTIEPLTAFLALVAGRAVKLHLTREEDAILVSKHGVEITMRTGVMADGRIVARATTCHFNTGAYAHIGPRLVKNGGFGTGGPHRIPHVAVDSYAVYTNIPTAGAFRGYGISQAAWAYETQLDMIAERLAIDPLEIRLRNLLQDGDTFATGEVVEDCHFRELLTDAAAHVAWSAGEEPVRRGSRVRGKGLSCIIKGTITPSTSTATAKLNEDGTLDVLTSSVEMGQGVQTAIAAIAAQVLGLSVERVAVSCVDTDVTPYDQVTGSSRSSYAMGAAVTAAAEDVRRQLLLLAADALEASPDDLFVRDGRIDVRGVPDRGIAIADIVRRARVGNIIGHGRYRSEGGLDAETGQGIASIHWHQAAGAAEVEVDLETGHVDLLRYHAGVYAGRILNPAQADLQTEGNVAFGIGQALFEEMVFEDGQLRNPNLGEYMIASVEDMPRELGLTILESADRHEIHGIGETSLPPVMPAIGNAIYRATGVRITDLPITPEKILRGLRERGRLPRRQEPEDDGQRQDRSWGASGRLT